MARPCNERGATVVARFSPRARAGLPVALPIGVSELTSEERPLLSESDFEHWKNRLKRNPWKEVRKLNQRLAPS